jgi:hypothetical protein
MISRLILVTALVAGLVGGVTGGFLSRYATPTPVFAQTRSAPAPDPKELRAQSFVLTDDQGSVVGTFKPSTPRSNELPTVVLLDAWGRETWRGKGAFIRPLGVSSER